MCDYENDKSYNFEKKLTMISEKIRVHPNSMNPESFRNWSLGWSENDQINPSLYLYDITTFSTLLQTSKGKSAQPCADVFARITDPHTVEKLSESSRRTLLKRENPRSS